MTPDSADLRGQSRLAWIYSIIMGISAFVFSLFYTFRLSGLLFVILSVVGAIIFARIAGWMASLDGRSAYGLLAGFIFVVIFPLSPLILLDFFALRDFVQESTKGGHMSMIMYVLHYVHGIRIAAPTALVVTLIFNLAFAVARMMKWVTVPQRWI